MKATKLTIREDYPCSISPPYSNISSIIFNIEYIQKKDPLLAIQLILSYKKAWSLLDEPVLNSNDEAFEAALMEMEGFCGTRQSH